MFLDLDRLKVINDSLGHTAGDEVLQAAAGLLRGSLRDVDTIARLGGDEFTIILENVVSLEHVTAVAEKIRKAFAEPFLIHDREFSVTASIGIALYPHDASDAESLLKAADVAMYQSKRTGRNTYTFYAAEMNEQAGERLRMEALLRHALDRQELVLHFRPRVGTADGKIVGVEALIRWNSAELGLVPPDRFTALAEETGLIEAIGEWVIQTACAQNRAWQGRGFPPLLLSVSLSLRQFRQKELVEKIAATLDKSGLAPHLLEFAITESVIMESIQESVGTLKALRSLGVNLAIDDFGTGNSSLGHLARLPMDTLKIDGTFVTGMTAGPEGLALVSTLINLAHSLRFKVVAEGVETEEQSRLLQVLNCDAMQGPLFSDPVPMEIFESRFLAAPPAGITKRAESPVTAGSDA
jgi:diguanylate cyclase (GGDEF)-like protein